MISAEPAHLLVVDDDIRLRGLLVRYLTQHHYHVTEAHDAAGARAKLQSFAFDLLVLDVMLPDLDGFQLTKALRETSDVPILLLTARGGAEDRITGLESGADDYLTKPFQPRELLLRIERILQRSAPKAIGGKVHFGNYTLDLDRGELVRNGEPVRLTSGEILLLSVLANRAGEPIERNRLAELAQINGSDRAVDTQMARLRRKLEEDPRQPRYLLTMRGQGYVLRTGV
ncbi:MAG: response regulator [Geminicoccaceae bacterium]